MHSVRAEISARVIEVSTGKVVATTKQTGSVGHISVEGGISEAMLKAGGLLVIEVPDKRGGADPKLCRYVPKRLSLNQGLVDV